MWALKRNKNGSSSYWQISINVNPNSDWRNPLGTFILFLYSAGSSHGALQSDGMFVDLFGVRETRRIIINTLAHIQNAQLGHSSLAYHQQRGCAINHLLLLKSQTIARNNVKRKKNRCVHSRRLIISWANFWLRIFILAICQWPKTLSLLKPRHTNTP